MHSTYLIFSLSATEQRDVASIIAKKGESILQQPSLQEWLAHVYTLTVCGPAPDLSTVVETFRLLKNSVI